MPGPPVTFGCVVVLSFIPPPALPPDAGTITIIPPGGPAAGGLPLAMSGSMCTMISSVSGVTYPLPIIKPAGQVKINGQALVRVGDIIQLGSTQLTIIGPPAAPFIFDATG